MTYEEFRAQEPPQARLLRLRGLFDKLMDADRDTALADGRAKDEWTKSAIRAQHGAFGPGRLTSDEASASSSSWFGSTSSSSSSSGPDSTGDKEKEKKRRKDPPPIPPRQSYANELLIQCRRCREELDRERSKERARQSEGSSWWNVLPGTGSSGSKAEESKKEEIISKAKGDAATLSGKHTTTSSSSGSSSSSSSGSESESSGTLGAITGALSSAASSVTSLFYDSPKPEEENSLDHEGEAGWAGSGVWGLSAVGSKQREKDREIDHRMKKGEDVRDDGPKRQRQIEWEGFLRYAEQKERELYDIFLELDKNADMKLDVGEIRTALDKAGE